MSGYSHSKLKRIKNYWLSVTPKEQFEYKHVKEIIYDGTYFHKNGCLINLMNATNQNIISYTYTQKEGFYNVLTWFLKLKSLGFNPSYVTMDGERSVIRAFKMIWPKIKIQRCLFHIQREGMRWLRTYPKTQAGYELRFLLSNLSTIKSFKERNQFTRTFKQWLIKHKSFIQSLPMTNIAFKDLKRTINLINNALPDMFHFLKRHNVHSTTNALESFHSRLKADYQRHRGLTEQHKIQYLAWYCYFKNL